jgi:hypothetical protein
MRRITIAAFLIIFVMLTASMTALGDDSSHAVVVSPTGEIDEGDTAEIEVHVFDKDQYVEPTAITASEFMGGEISLTKKSTGIWTGSFDPDQASMVYANAEIDTKSATGGLMMRVNPSDQPAEVEISIEPKDPAALVKAQPGDKLDFVIEIYKDGKLKDDNSLEVTITNWQTWDQEVLAKSKTTTGTYETSFTVPQLTESTDYEIEAEINEGSADIDFEINFFQVWIKKGTFSTTDASFDLYVADGNGKAVNGAEIEFEYSYDEMDSWEYITKDAGKATTDNTGKASYTITYSKVDREVYLDGTVVKDGKTQHFSGSIIITATSSGNGFEPPEPDGYGLEVIYQEDDEKALKPGKTVDLKYRAYHTEGWGDPEPFASKDIYYYAHTYTTVVKYGKVTTDSDGFLTINIKIPSIKGDYDILMMDFQAETSTDTWEDDMGGHYIADSSYYDILDNPEVLKDTGVKITVDQLKVGDESSIKATYSKTKKESEAMVMWIPGQHNIKDLFGVGDTQPDWDHLGGMDYGSYMSKKGDTFSSTILIPEFMPKTTYTIFVMVIDVDFEDIVLNPQDYIHINYISVKVSEGGTTDDGDDGMFGMGTVGGIDVFLILLILIIIVVIVVIAVVATRRRAPPPAYQPGAYQPPGTQPQQPTTPGQPPPQQPLPATPVPDQQPAAPPPQQPGYEPPPAPPQQQPPAPPQ